MFVGLSIKPGKPVGDDTLCYKSQRFHHSWFGLEQNVIQVLDWSAFTKWESCNPNSKLMFFSQAMSCSHSYNGCDNFFCFYILFFWTKALGLRHPSSPHNPFYFKATMHLIPFSIHQLLHCIRQDMSFVQLLKNIGVSP